MVMNEKNAKPGANSETNASRLLGYSTPADEELSGSSILKDFASDFIDPKAVGYGFLL